jgi:hypothetical protein
MVGVADGDHDRQSPCQPFTLGQSRVVQADCPSSGARSGEDFADRPRDGSSAMDNESEGGAWSLFRNGDRPLRTVLDTASRGHVNQADHVLAVRNFAAREHTNIGFDASTETGRLNQHAKREARCHLSRRRNADRHSPSRRPLLNGTGGASAARKKGRYK